MTGWICSKLTVLLTVGCVVKNRAQRSLSLYSSTMAANCKGFKAGATSQGAGLGVWALVVVEAVEATMVH